MVVAATQRARVSSRPMWAASRAAVVFPGLVVALGRAVCLAGAVRPIRVARLAGAVRPIWVAQPAGAVRPIRVARLAGAVRPIRAVCPAGAAGGGLPGRTLRP
jgi:hypothetical protein